MTPLLDINAALLPLRLRGDALAAEISKAVTGTPSIDLSSDSVSQMSLDVQDPELALLASRLFTARTLIAYGDLSFEVASLQVSGEAVPSLVIEARSAGAQVLRRTKGALVRRNISPTDYLAGAAHAAGLHFVGEPSAVRPQIARAGGAKASEQESDWDVGQRLASQLGFFFFEAGGTLYFGRPTWLIARGTTRPTRWPKPLGAELQLIGVPTCRRTVDGSDAVTVEVSFPWSQGHLLRPGDALQLAGVPTFEGRYLITSVSIPLDASQPVGVSATTPVDPEPQPEQTASDADTHDESGRTGSTRDATDTVAGGASGSGVSVKGYAWPASGTISSKFGAARPNGRKHAGIDIAAPTGTRVMASRGGTVSIAGWQSGYGNVIYLDHGDGATTRYGHLSKFLCKKGQRVELGQLIGLMGNTGVSSGPHLHFEIRLNGVAIDPLRTLPKATAKQKAGGHQEF